jgi:hypothetical protein
MGNAAVIEVEPGHQVPIVEARPGMRPWRE